MPVNFAVKPFNSPTSTGNQDITHSGLGGLTAEGALIVLSGHNTSNDPGDTANCRIMFGGCDAGAQFSVGVTSMDNTVATDVRRSAYRTDLVISNGTPGSGTFFLNASESSFVSDGVRLNWTDVQGSAYRGIAILGAGTDFEVDAGTINLGTGTSAITITSGFAADVVFFFGNQTSNTVAGGDFFGCVIGIATRDGTQKCVAWAEADNIAAGGQPSQVILSNKCFAQQSQTAGTQDYTVTAGNFTATAFDVTPSANAGSDLVGYVAMRFGGKSVKLWDFSTPTSTGNVSDNTPGFTPEFGFIVGTNLEALDTGSFDANTAGGLGISAFTADDQIALSWYIDATADPTNTGSDAKANALRVGNGTGSAGVVADLVSLNNTGWTLNYTSVQANSKKAFALAVGVPFIPSARRKAIISY